jgi:hypothetical protein
LIKNSRLGLLFFLARKIRVEKFTLKSSSVINTKEQKMLKPGLPNNIKPQIFFLLP